MQEFPENYNNLANYDLTYIISNAFDLCKD